MLSLTTAFNQPLTMDNNTIYTKSARGHEAVQQRTPDLSMEERRVLIMTDGKRTVGELLKQITSSIDVIRHLERLLHAGYIVQQGGTFIPTIPTIPTISSAQTAMPAPPPPVNPSAARPTGGVQTDWAMRDTIKDILKQELTEFMGPLAPFICDDVCPKVNTLEEALTALAGELGDPAKGARFRENVMKRLKAT